MHPFAILQSDVHSHLLDLDACVEDVGFVADEQVVGKLFGEFLF